MKNKLTIIGYLGGKSCYLNISKEEAIERYIKDNNILDIDDVLFTRVEEIEFDDEFRVYDIWEK